MMPLFHIGGIMRNILSPILSGGCVITCAGFDPLLFWDVLSGSGTKNGAPSFSSKKVKNAVASLEKRVLIADMPDASGAKAVAYCTVDGDQSSPPRTILPTWYYAAPTMHHAILQEAERRYSPGSEPAETVRFVANAAGGLLPSLAEALKETFSNAVVLTSYGMTEWFVEVSTYIQCFPAA
jgi:acyl-CoA synthetase (AMP-forming)/AMP-acid ligase II